METNRIYNENCLETLARMPDGSLDCVVTSPPYYGLRDYGTADQIGLEKTPAEYVAKMLEVFREIRRVLKPEGTCWLNLGDSYAGSGRGRNADGTHSAKETDKQFTSKGTINGRLVNENSLSKNLIEQGAIGNAWVKPPAGFKAKDLIGIPWRVAFALQDDGWYLRQDIIWAKPNPMPESVTDRCTKAHEYIFLLTKSAKYFYDHDAIKEASTFAAPGNKTHAAATEFENGDSHHRTKSGLVGYAEKMRGTLRPNEGFNKKWDLMSREEQAAFGRNKRSVWNVATRPFPDAHFATFPEDLIRPMILAGCPADGIVYDPFMGAGTTALVAHKFGRQWIGSELSAEYCDIAAKRLQPHLDQERLFV